MTYVLGAAGPLAAKTSPEAPTIAGHRPDRRDDEEGDAQHPDAPGAQARCDVGRGRRDGGVLRGRGRGVAGLQCS